MTDLRTRVASLPRERRAEFLGRLRSARPGPSGDVIVPHRQGETTTRAPLTYSQRTIWFLEQLGAVGKPAFHLPNYYRLRGRLDIEALRLALTGVVDRHGALRTRIVIEDASPIQVVERQVPVDLPVTEIGNGHGDVFEEALRRATREVSMPAFSFGQAPLWRARLYRLGPDDHLFVFVSHHLIADKSSAELFGAELDELYYGQVTGEQPLLPELPIQYADFAWWQHEHSDESRLDLLGKYWRDQLGGAAELELPSDRPRPDVISFRGREIARDLRRGLGREVLDFARAMNTTAYVVYLAACWVMLHRLSGQDDVVVGASMPGRLRQEAASLIGAFATEIGLRDQFAADRTFRQVVMEADRVLTEALAHSDISFEEVVNAVELRRDLSRSPLFQVGLRVAGDRTGGRLGDLTMDAVYRSHDSARLDLALTVAGTSNITVTAEYSADLYDEETVLAMMDTFAITLEKLLASTDSNVSAMELSPSWVSRLSMLMCVADD
jgi:hypothetical protein